MHTNRQKKALILGITGQDGAYLAQLLLSKNYEVYGTSRDVEMASFRNLDSLGIKSKITMQSLTLTDFRSVLQTLTKVLPDEIYNLAGQSSVSLSFQQPIETLESITIGTINLLEAIRFTSHDLKFYNACSGECFGEIGNVPADEITPFKPKSPYAVAKAAAFWQVANYRYAYNMFACSGILFNHESPLRPERFVTQKIVSTAIRIASGSKEKLQLGNIEIQRDWGWAPDYVKAMWLMLQQNKPDDYVIATGICNSLKTFLNLVFSSLNLQWQNHVVIDSSLIRPSDINSSFGNPEKAKRKLRWEASLKLEQIATELTSARTKSTSESN